MMQTTTTTEAKVSWRDVPELMAAIRRLQNHPANVGRDVLTICGFFERRSEFERHIKALDADAARYEEGR